MPPRKGITPRQRAARRKNAAKASFARTLGRGRKQTPKRAK